MKPRLLLYITADSDPARNAVAATLAWAASDAGWQFEVYYDAYRTGDHYGGGDPDSMPRETLTGGLLTGGRHIERLYLLLHRFDTLAIARRDVSLDQALQRAGAARITPDSIEDLYDQAFAALGRPLPASAIILDAHPSAALASIDAYAYPEIIARKALGLEATCVAESAVRWMDARDVSQRHTLWVGPTARAALPAALAGLPDLDPPGADDTFTSVTQRLARRWRERFPGGWLLADPLTVSAWLPEAARERRLAIYGKPQREIIQALRHELAASEVAVLGRQYEDSDFFDLSALGVAFQLIDPNRPAFPVLRQTGPGGAPVVAPAPAPHAEPDDDQLAEWARAGRVLSSVVFWSGMIRELENLPAIMDLVALTKLSAGVALTVPALDYQPEAPVELLRVPLERGGVYPNLEMLLASCGVGAAIESSMPSGRLATHLASAMRMLDDLGVPQEWRPTGWWTAMDPDLIALPKLRSPLTPELGRHAPFLRLRYTPAANQYTGAPTASTGMTEATGDASAAPRRPSRRRRVGAWARSHGLNAALAPYRPYERFKPGPLRHDVIEAAKAAGLRYVFSKAGFGDPPRALSVSENFIAMNYTAGRWDGWTPFETINDIADLRVAERRLLASRRPGWLVGTLDACLWTFTGPIWRRGAALRDIAAFLASGGDSGQLINVTPRVIARYARIVAGSGEGR